MNHLTLKYATANSFIKFLLVGTVNTTIGLSTMLFLQNGLMLPYWFSTFTGNSIGAGTSFILNRAFTFNSNVSLRKGGPKFIAVILASYILSFSLSLAVSAVLSLGTSWVSPDNFAIILGSCIYTVTNYFGQKLFVFNSKA
ncbi:GtrA family protein [Bacillus sp. REN3]|uniref:GtrA family protein n=1 Tax=Bacillus sp. REN3 TaxID=2802440 RepID=UPI001AEEAA74|nr:GtrA family protein [Bacillus sp. REN3]